MLYPSLREFISVVKNNDKRIGLRMLYKKYHVSAPERAKYREMWDAIVDEAEEKLIEREEGTGKNASEKREKPESNQQQHQPAEEGRVSSETGGGDSDEQSGQEEQEQETVPQETQT